jgi:hypothetical protein
MLTGTSRSLPIHLTSRLPMLPRRLSLILVTPKQVIRSCRWRDSR